MGAIWYKPCEDYEEQMIPAVIRSLGDGWGIWCEKRHVDQETYHFLLLFWQPFLVKGQVKNTLSGAQCSKGQIKEYFSEVLTDFAAQIGQMTDVKKLSMEYAVDFLAGSIEPRKKEVEFPKYPLYFDAYLSLDEDIRFEENGLTINGKKLLILSLPENPPVFIMNTLYKNFSHMNYRYFRRFLFCSPAYAKSLMAAYTKRWCHNRQSMKQLIMDGLFSEHNAYFAAAFIFYVDEADYDSSVEFIQAKMKEKELTYIIEETNLKDIWWSSIPGVFRANLTPPILGVRTLDQLLISGEGSDENVPFRSVSSDEKLS